MYITSFTDAAIRMHNINALCRNNEMLNIFTDESIIESYIEAAAVTFRLNKRRIYYMDTEEMITVFKTELQEIVITTVMTMTIKKTQR